MKYRTLGRTGIRISEVGFGAWAIGGTMWGGKRDADARAALECALAEGVNFIDTALVYGDGHSERLIGKFLQAHKSSEIYVATKVPPKSMRWPAGRDAKLADVFPPAWIAKSCEASLKNLGVDHIDLLQLHVWEDAFTTE